MTDRVTEAFIAAARTPGSALAKLDVGAALGSLGYDYLARPMFFDAAELDRFSADTARTVELIFALPDLLFDGDFARFRDELRIAPEHGRLMERAGAAPPRFGRIDAYHDGETFKILEFNIGSDAGGQDWVGAVPRALLEVAEFAGFAREHELTYTDTFPLVAQLLREAGGPDPVVALVGEPGDTDPGPWTPFRELLREAGFETYFGAITDLSVRGGRVFLGDVRLDVLYRLFLADSLDGDPAAAEIAQALHRTHADGGVVLWTTLESEVFGNKGCLALLNEPRVRRQLSTVDSQLLDRVLPWTRSLAAGDDIGEYLGRREQLILKPNGCFGGRGITAGWEVDEAVWRRALLDAAPGGAVVQERVVPRAEPVYDPATDEITPWEACWGLYHTPSGKFAGGGCRFLPHGSARISAPASGVPIEGRSIFESYRAGIFRYPGGR
ncbi:hypothetical protein [Amycolatopsis vastitatis]|uniref:Glutathionylspermidine synthase pre-ATP-grasp-like domain-containing protein n=1 Tax=Amycolatopsis vastitatis TaxID=1905142 RepID=A0A229SYF1_9PSEU|nr:hypothetical protein [Amycolatopsis vastitatis]OXM64177.1 hypothetical protein CF165_27985 [Amycolatopsis vastitatis]